MSDDRAAEVARLREDADRSAEVAKRHPSFWREVEYLRDRADRIEAGGIRTAADFTEDYGEAEDRLHTTGMVDALVGHAEKWEAEIRADAYSRALTYLASAHGNLMSNGDRHAARIVQGWLVKAHADLLASPAHDAAVAAKAWDEGYAVGEDNFIHSDYCGRSCQCQGLHGATNPYREGGRDA